ncbi:hypothetical protein KRX51_04330 [Corynebacterium sp. TAE3-ERU12]|uniref:hypothetical protein n=1 Tax=Corynebacterium sp. TAE3-ERU12 TaxID=2849491 RepID=UPI001C4497A8|nr:hypothetical protein [Corynebacterium sp. TAE3-ERU12]MBV7295146.1 hypothetical protein [Corynebacterium sp. TAE3-ERU12]
MWKPPVRTFIVALTVFGCALTGAITPAPARAVPLPNLDQAGNLRAPAQTQITVAYFPAGLRVGTANQHEPRPGLSMVKLYIGHYIVREGNALDIPAVRQMIRASDDQIATRLYKKYPQSIKRIAEDYGLSDTKAGASWGVSRTSSYDLVTFLLRLQLEDPAGPVLDAMRNPYPVAADGYPQNFGTATLPGVTGTKLGWSNDRVSHHASASIGPGFVVAAETRGTREAHTNDVRNAFITIDSVSGSAPIPQLPGSAEVPIPGLG